MSGLSQSGTAPSIAVVDYCKGNLKSVERGLMAVGGNAFITDDPYQISKAQAIVLPGVGSFCDASCSMTQSGQMEAVRRAIMDGVPFLGICLGLHLLFADGTEGAPGKDSLPGGLDILPGTVDRMPQNDASGAEFKIPHVGWNTIEIPAAKDAAEFSTPLLANVEPGEYFYFTHSYIAPQGEYTRAITTHSTTFPCAVQYGNTCFGVQFHPEKSSDAGLKVLRNFCDIVDAAVAR